MLMSKNVNNDVSKDSPIEAAKSFDVHNFLTFGQKCHHT